MTAIISSLHFAVIIPHSIEDYLGQHYKNTLFIEINDVEASEIESLRGDGINIMTNTININYDIMLSSDMADLEVEESIKGYTYYLENFFYQYSLEALEIFLIQDGRLWNEQDNYANDDDTYNIWLSSEISEYLGAEYGDIITYNSSYYNSEIPIKVAGIYELNDSMIRIPLPSFIIPYGMHSSITNANDTMDLAIFANGYDNISDLFGRIENSDIEYEDNSGLLDDFYLIELMAYALWVLVIILIFSSIVLLLNNFFYIMNRRVNYINMLTNIGYKKTSIYISYFIILELIITIAMLLSLPFSYIINKYISDVIYDYSLYTLDYHINFFVILMLFVVSTFISISYYLYNLKKYRV